MSALAIARLILIIASFLFWPFLVSLPSAYDYHLIPKGMCSVFLCFFPTINTAYLGRVPYLGKTPPLNVPSYL
jgi:hypothetical protein